MAKQNLKDIRKKISSILKKYPVLKAGLFGSVTREDFDDKSDIDILVNFDQKANLSLFDIAHINNALEDVLERKVDLVQYHNIKPALKNFILPTELVIYEKNN